MWHGQIYVKDGVVYGWTIYNTNNTDFGWAETADGMLRGRSCDLVGFLSHVDKLCGGDICPYDTWQEKDE